MTDTDTSDCIFCRIGRHEAPAEFLYEDDHLFVIRDRFPKAPVHLLVIPRKHIACIDALTEGDDDLVAHIFEVIRFVAARYRLESGYRVIINSGPGAGQTVSHLHVHLIAGASIGFKDGTPA